MKVFTVQRTIPPNVLSKKNFKKITLLLFALFCSVHFYEAFSVSGKPFFLNHRGISEKPIRQHQIVPLKVPLFDISRFNNSKPNGFKQKNNSILNQISITSVLKTAYCTGESGTIVFETSGVFNSNNRFSVQLSNFNGSFVAPTIIGFISSSVVGTHTVPFKIPVNTQIGNGYRMRIVASSPSTNSPNNLVNIQISTFPVPSVALSSQIICPGSSATLSATCGSGTIKWYDAQENGNVITNLTVNPTVSTDYFAACEGGTGCSGLRARQIIIVNKPDVIVPSYASSCVNSDLELAVVSDETNLVYSWSGPSGFTSTLQNPTISDLTVAKEGLYTVTITNANSCFITATTAVEIGTVLQSLSVVGNINICFGDTINLNASASVTTGMNYSWTGPDTFTSTGRILKRPASLINTNGNITYHEGNYTVVANNPTTGCTGTTSVDILVGKRPNIPLILPAGSSCGGVDFGFNLAISGANFQRYSWTGPNNFTATTIAVCDSNKICVDNIINIQNFSSINAGTYALSANFIDENNLLCSVKTTKTISLKPDPVISVSSNSVVCLGDVLIFQSTHDPAVTAINSYSWTGPNNYTSNVQNPIIYTTSVAGTGVYTLTVLGVNSCIAKATSMANIVESVPPFVEQTAGVVLSNSITLTATGCNNGILNWFDANNNQSVAMPISPSVATSYYSKCNVLGCVSGKSGDILVSILPPIAISVKTGDWEDKNTWSISRVPLPIDSVIIRPTHFVTINAQAYAKWLAWTGFGNLRFASANSKLNLFGNPIIPPPLLKSNPVLVVEGNSVSFTATGKGVISWFKNGINLNISDSTYTVNQPTAGDVYTAKSTVDGVVSKISNAITVMAMPSPPVLSSNPASVVENVSVTFTAAGSGVISWYKNGVDLNISTSTYTVNQPVAGDVYTTKRTVDGITSVNSNSITVVAASTPPLVVNPPTISSNPSTVLQNVSVTFTATGSGVISWFKNGVNLNINGTTYMVNQPVLGDVYTAKRTEGGTTSEASNSITVTSYTPPSSSGVTITEPNKPPYYFSDGHPPSHYNNNLNSPVIFTNQPRYDPVNDLVWLTNDKIKIGINLKRGGQLAWASLINSTSNLVYNGYDGGFQVTLDAYQRRDGYTQGGEVAGSAHAGMPKSYNVTQGGDYMNHAVSLIDYHSVPNGFYVKIRPIHYPLSAKLSQNYIEATYTIIGRSVKIDYRYTSFRTDGQWDGAGFDGAGAPACFIVNTLNKYKTFTGNSPWSFLPTEGGNLPIQNNGQNPAGAHATEYWGMVYDDNNPNSGIGVYNATNGGNSTYFTFKQLEVYGFNGPGTEFTNGFTFFQPFIDFNIANRGNYVKDITAFLIIGSELEIRSEVYKISGHESNIPRF